MKIISWNINGIRAALGRGFLDFLDTCGADVVCLQEVKARREQVACDFPGWQVAWNSAVRPGYSGTATLVRPNRKILDHSCGIGSPEHDSEGRVLTHEFEIFFLVNVYVPNSGQELARLDYRTRAWGPAFRAYLSNLARRKPVVFCGDLNVAHQEIDLARPKENVGNAGFTPEERHDFGKLLGAGFCDTFRSQEKNAGHYTWWSYRAGARERNIGWRIDYVCISPELLPKLDHAFILPEILGSDHCPVGIEISI